MASTEIGPVADAIKLTLEGIDGLSVAKWVPAELKKRPTAVIELPEISRSGVEQGESQLGSNDWDFMFPVIFYFDLGDSASKAQDGAMEYVEQWIQAVDANPSLNATVFEAKVTAARVVYITDQNKPLLAYETDLQALRLVLT